MEVKVLPHSNKRYTVSMDGIVIDTFTDVIIKPTLRDNHFHVYINWLSDMRYVPIGVLIIVTYLEMYVSDDNWLDLLPLYKDGNPENICLENLTYRFSKPIESSYKGYYHIPFYTGYVINRSGEIFSTFSKSIKTWAFTKPNLTKNSKGGYAYTRLKANLDGKSKLLFRHRALGLSFLDYDHRIDKMVINHIDGIPGNDQLSNLQWCTHKENNAHAYESGLRPNAVRGISVKNLLTGEIVNYSSINECVRELDDITASIITYRIKHCPNKVFEDRLLFKYSNDESPWPNVDPTFFHRVGKVKDIVVKDVLNSNVTIFANAAHAESILGVTQNTILKHAKKDSNIPVKGYLFRYGDSHIPFPDFSADVLSLIEDRPTKVHNGYIVTNIANGERIVYKNLNAICEGLDVVRSVLLSYCDTTKLFRDKYMIELLDITSVPLTSDS